MKEAMKKKTNKVLNNPWFKIGIGAIGAAASAVVLTESGINILVAEGEIAAKSAAKKAAKQSAEEAEAEEAEME